MKKKPGFIIMLLIVFVIIVSMIGVSAASPISHRYKWELGAGIGFNIPFINTTYYNTYSPVFSFDSPDIFISTASQVLNITNKKDTGISFSFMVNRLITKKWGIQLLGVLHKTPLNGTDNSYYNYLEYTAYFYPDFNPTLVTREYDEKWPDTGGYLKQSTISLNVMTRLYPGSGITIDFSAGPGIFAFKGDISSLGYTIYKPRHTFLDYYPDKLNVSINGVKLGLNIGGELNIPLFRNFHVFFTCRYFYCPNASTEIKPEEIIYFIGGNSTLDDISSVMNPRDLKINLSFLHLNAGFKLRF